MDQALPNLLFLTQRIPYPPTKGEKIRPLQILKYLRHHFDIHLGCLIDDPRDMVYVDTVRALCTTSHFAPLDRTRSKVTCLRGLFTGHPLSVTFYNNRGLASWVSDVLDAVKPEVIFVCSSNMAPYILDSRHNARVCLVDLADVDSEKWRDYGNRGAFPMSWVHMREWRQIAKLERRIATECHWSTFVSQDEADLFASLVPSCRSKIRSVSSGVDHTYFDPACEHSPPPFDVVRLNFVFTGTMEYPPNVDAVVWFTHKILPVIRRSRPDAQFHIVGSSPAPAVTALARIDGVFVTGRVPDVRPYLAHATAGVAPMRIARGIQNKVLEGMAMAKPMIVTTGALTGIHAVPGREVILADEPNTFSAGCLQAAEPAAQAIGKAARRLVLAEYVWSQRLRGFDALLGYGPAMNTAPRASTVEESSP